MAHLEWLNREFLEKCLGEEVSVFSTSSAVPPGNNYGSCVTRVSLKLKNKEAESSVIVKSELIEGPLFDSLAIAKSSEHYFYYSFIPEAQKITEVNFAPKTFPSPRPYTVVLEDLSEQGFLMVDRLKQLDFDHCKLYMIAAAEFHAVSFAVNKSNPKILEQFTMEKMFKDFEKGVESFKAMATYGIACFIECTEREKQFKRVSEIVSGLSDRFWGILMEIYMPGENLTTLTQGDPWITNMMFRYNDRGEVDGIKLLDFQSLKIASPIHDLVFFIWSSSNNDVRNSRIHDLFQIYLDTFNANLLKYKCDEVLTYEEFMSQIKKLSHQVMFVATSFLPLVLDPAPMDFAAIFGGRQTENPFRKVYSDNFCKVHLPQVIAQMEKMGVIDYLENYPKK